MKYDDRGAIKTSNDLKDLIIEARKEKKTIPLYEVKQMGVITIFYLTSESKYIKNETTKGSCVGSSFDKVTGYQEYEDQLIKTYILIGSFCIDGTGYGSEFRLFTNRCLAEEYSQRLRNDPKYVQSVKEHWARCDDLWRSLEI